MILCLLFKIISASVLENYYGLLNSPYTIWLVKVCHRTLLCPCNPCSTTAGSLWLAVLSVRAQIPVTFLLCRSAHTEAHNSALAEVRGKPAWSPPTVWGGILAWSFLPPWGLWRLNSGLQAWWHLPLPSEPSCWPKTSNF